MRDALVNLMHVAAVIRYAWFAVWLLRAVGNADEVPDCGRLFLILGIAGITVTVVVALLAVAVHAPGISMFSLTVW